LTDFESVEIGQGFGLAKDRRGRVYGWGSNASGQLGEGDNVPRQHLISLTQLNKEGVTLQVTAGSNSAIAVVSTSQQPVPFSPSTQTTQVASYNSFKSPGGVFGHATDGPPNPPPHSSY